jgi:hypothetical protein
MLWKRTGLLPDGSVGIGQKKKGGALQVGEVIHLDGQRAEYSLYGRDRFSACTLPDGDYVVLGFEENYVKLAWSDSDGGASRKHRYRIDRAAVSLR